MPSAAPPRVSVRAAVLALGRFGVTDADTVKTLEKRWKKHRQEHQLDLYGALSPKPDVAGQRGPLRRHFRSITNVR